MKFKYLQRTTAVLLVACITLMLNVNIFAEVPTEDVDNSAANTITVDAIKISLLTELGILIKGENDYTKTVTRGEFAKIIVHIANLEMSEEKVEVSKFSDVKKTNINITYIEKVSDFGYMNGISKGKFAPDQNISLAEAVVAFVRILGYEEYAINMGGYPRGYMQVAYDRNFFGSLRVSDDKLTLADIINICYNVLNIDLLRIVDAGVATKYEALKNKTILTEYHDIYNGNGIVTANRYTSLSTEDAVCKEDEIEINKDLYQLNDSSFENYLGYSVEFYYRKLSEDDDKRVVVALVPKSKNEVTNIKAEDILYPLKDNVISAYSEIGKKSDYILLNGFHYILNNRVVLSRTMDDLEIKDGSFTLIDNNFDGIYDVVTAERIETFEALSVDPIEFIIYCETDNILIDTYEEGTYYSLKLVDKKGGLITIDIDEVKMGNVLTVYRSKDNKYVRAFVSGVEKTGSINEISEDEVNITFGNNTAWYKLTPDFDASDLTVNATVNCILDVFGRLASIKSTIYKDGYNYGYIFKGADVIGVKGGIDLQLITKDKVEVFNCKDEIMIDGVSKQSVKGAQLFKNDEFIKQLVRFKLDNDNKIISIDTKLSGLGNSDDSLTLVESNASRTYYSALNSFGNQSVLNSNTAVFRMPLSGIYKSDIEYYSPGFVLATETAYTLDLYDLNENLEWGAVVVSTDVSPKRPVLNKDGYYKMGVIIKKTSAITNDGEPVIRLHMYYNGSRVYYDLDPEQYNSTDLEFGDIIRFELNDEEMIGTWEYELDLTQGTPNRPTAGYFSMTYGKIFENYTNRFILITTQGNPDMSEDNQFKKIIPSKGTKYCVVDFANKTISPASSANLVKDDYVYTKVYKYGTLHEAIIYRGKPAGGSE